MATVTKTVLICDGCGSDESANNVATHRMTLDRKKVEVEACDSCWDGLKNAAQPLLSKGRKMSRKPVGV